MEVSGDLSCGPSILIYQKPSTTRRLFRNNVCQNYQLGPHGILGIWIRQPSLRFLRTVEKVKGSMFKVLITSGKL